MNEDEDDKERNGGLMYDDPYGDYDSDYDCLDYPDMDPGD